MSDIEIATIIPEELAGKRLDAAVAELIPEHSRARLQQWTKSGHLLLNGKTAKNKDKVEIGDKITIKAPPLDLPSFAAEDIPLNVLYEDEDIIVINKPIGLVAHPAAGNYQGTLLNALLFHYPELEQVPRAGIIHRLDKDTSGVLVVARNLTAHTKLVDALQARDIKREYLALVQGEIVSGDTIETQMGRHPRSRTKMAVVPIGKEAVTHYRVEKKYGHHTLLRVNLETGRTHQIRVHMAHIRHPIVGDQTYAQLRLPKRCSENLKQTLRGFTRQALHAHKLGLEHPKTEEFMEFSAPVPEDMQHLLDVLETEDAQQY